MLKAKYKFGSKKSNIRSFNNSQEIFEYIKEIASDITKVTEQELNTETQELEDVEYYITDSGKKQRVTSVLKESSKWLYQNIDKSDVAEAIREAKMQKGTDVHKTLEDIVERFVDKDTGKLRTLPTDAPQNTLVDKNIYKILVCLFVRLYLRLTVPQSNCWLASQPNCLLPACYQPACLLPVCPPVLFSLFSISLTFSSI